ncbi:DEAD/DEAH box helicase [Aliarcobacter butzleri]|uniref:DEAD/DEAH box helicase n=1 Tax=Aliarcobacter butzleri TaxID=28197 RepID=UPI00344B314D
MYDAHSIELIHSAHSFGGINFNNLPKEFTSAYTEIVSLRLRINQNTEINEEELVTEVQKLYKIAQTYETYVILKYENSDIKSAAYIAAIAHSLIYEINKLIYSEFNRNEKILTPNGIHPLLSAAFLYFISGYVADTIEVIKKLPMLTDDSKENKLFIALKQLLTGAISNVNTEVRYEINNLSEKEVSDLLWLKLHEATNELLLVCSYQEENISNSFNKANEIINLVLELSVFENNITVEDFNINSKSIFIGQNYLANFLKIVVSIIPNVALICQTIPNNIDEHIWKERLKRFTKERAYLWPNHLHAINSGYLNKGISSVISFPTGGGKSTLSELKILVSLISNEPIVFIVPTLALVDQVTNTLREIFPESRVNSIYEMFSNSNEEEMTLPNISVMTPESCLVKMNFNPELFSNLGLFIFDECHLLNPKLTNSMDRRSVDAMFCLLKAIELSNNVDILLLSAMLSNSEEIAQWLSSIINKDVLPLTLTWKPTQQVKGCVVYKNDDIVELESFIQSAPRTGKNHLTASVKRELKILPYGFFSMNQTWQSSQVSDYKFTNLINEKILLNTNDSNQLTSNRNEVAAKLAINSTRNKIKTLIFGLTKKDCESISKTISNELFNTLTFTDNEQRLLDLLIIEFGDSSSLYVSNRISSLPHHGLLTSNERKLHEMLFKRDDGINALVATSTLAQGINLPAELVIIAGDSRFNEELNRQEIFEAHELLNAAGRAGRAGKNSKGMVLVIPGKVVSYNSVNRQITNHWHELKEIFSGSDQCVKLEDPFEYILNKLFLSQDINNDEIYFLKNLPVNNINVFVNKTFIAYKKSLEGNSDWINQRAEAISAKLNQITEVSESNLWIKNLSSSTGISSSQLENLYNDLIIDVNNLNSPLEIISWYINWLVSNPINLNTFLRLDVFDEEFGNPYRGYLIEAKKTFISNQLLILINQWISGNTLKQIDDRIPSSRNSSKCEKARKFSLKIIPEISYSIGILCQIYKGYNQNNPEAEINLNLELISLFIKYGVDSPEKLALHYIIKNNTTRVNTHLIFTLMQSYIENMEGINQFSIIKRRVKTAYERYSENN